MSIKLANKFLEKNKINERILAKIDEYEEPLENEEYELVPKIKNRRISSIFRIKERKVSQFTLDCVITIVICFAIFVQGLITSQTIQDHRLILGLSHVFGSLLSSVFLNVLGRSKCCVLFSLAIASTNVLAFKSTDQWLFPVIGSLASGALKTSLIVWTIDIWRNKSHAFLQILFFFWSLGTLSINLVNEFSDQKDDNGTHFHKIEKQKNITSNDSNMDDGDLKSISDVCNSFLAICVVSLFVIINDNHKHFKKRSVQLKFKSKMTKNLLRRLFVTNSCEEKIFTLKEQCFVVIASIILLAAIISIDFANCQLIMHFAKQEFSVKTVALIRNASQTLMSFISIFIAIALKPRFLLILILLITGSSNLALVLFASNSFAIFIIVTVVSSAGFLPMIASVLALMDNYIAINNNIGAIVTSSGALLSVLNTQFIPKNNNNLFYTSMTFVSIALALIVLAMILFSRFFINSCESFNVKPISAKFGSNKYTFESEPEVEFKDNYGWNGIFKVRDTSIVSI